MNESTTIIVNLVAQQWTRVTVQEPMLARVAVTSTTTPTGQIYYLKGDAPPPTDAGSQFNLCAYADGYGTLSLTSSGSWQIYYDGTASTSQQLVLEPLAGRDPPNAEQKGWQFVRTRQQFAPLSGGTGVALSANPRRKTCTFATPDGGIFYLLVSATANPSATSFDFGVGPGAFVTLSGDDCPRGRITFYNATGISAVLNVSEGE